ncbi:uncharacterized protein LOC135397703 isoform X2 [Ornithodoros turicata]|uniref:uncharacterized protein LOC135397703 isoform X2 n=1 Tax=Ornithodoros turicata TaxID=34597 RepID=UPI00313A2524
MFHTSDTKMIGSASRLNSGKSSSSLTFYDFDLNSELHEAAPPAAQVESTEPERRKVSWYMVAASALGTSLIIGYLLLEGFGPAIGALEMLDDEKSDNAFASSTLHNGTKLQQLIDQLQDHEAQRHEDSKGRSTSESTDNFQDDVTSTGDYRDFTTDEEPVHTTRKSATRHSPKTPETLSTKRSSVSTQSASAGTHTLRATEKAGSKLATAAPVTITTSTATFKNTTATLSGRKYEPKRKTQLSPLQKRGTQKKLEPTSNSTVRGRINVSTDFTPMKSSANKGRVKDSQAWKTSSATRDA